MAKTKTTFFCQNCGTQFSKWQGQCSACKEWNTIVEEVVQKAEKNNWQPQSSKTKRVQQSQKVEDITFTQEQRYNTKNNELNRVLGGGLVPGSLTLLGGEPGIGKSTLMLQIAFLIFYSYQENLHEYKHQLVQQLLIKFFQLFLH